ncbi:hypothetical protein OUHCRE6_23160 [Enterobacter hormaechei subsp. steigerwaltii]
MHIKITGNAMSIVNLSNARFNLFLLLLCVNKDFIHITNSNTTRATAITYAVVSREFNTLS